MLICLMGGSSVGKDLLQNTISNKFNIPICISSTTRPMREGEINHKTYHFVSEEEFMRDFNNSKFLEHRTYDTANGTWYYGLSVDSVDISSTQIVIVDQKGYFEILEKLGQENVIGIYVYAPERIKIQRFLDRESRNDDKFFEEFYRRMLDDLTAFDVVKCNGRVLKIRNVDLEKAIEGIEFYLRNKGVIA